MTTVSCLLFVAFLALAAPPQTDAISKSEKLAHASFKQLVNFFSDAIEGKQVFKESLIPQKMYQRHAGEQLRWAVIGPNSFSFKNCAKPKDELVVPSKVSLTPDPIKLPGNVTAGGSVLIKETLGSPLKVQLKVEYKLAPDVWIKVPCLENIGSCTYNDFCKDFTIKSCPPEIEKVGLTCKCPFPKGDFTVDSLKLFLGFTLPVSCHIKVKATISHQEKLATCVQVELNLTKGASTETAKQIPASVLSQEMNQKYREAFRKPGKAIIH